MTEFDEYIKESEQRVEESKARVQTLIDSGKKVPFRIKVLSGLLLMTDAAIRKLGDKG